MAEAEEIREIRWQTETLLIVLTIDKQDRVVRLKEITSNVASTETAKKKSRSNLFSDSSSPLTEIRLAGEGTSDHKSARNLICGSVSLRSKYLSHRETVIDPGDEDNTSGAKQQKLEITSHDSVSKLTVVATLIVFGSTPVLRSYTIVRNDGTEDVVLTQVSSLVVGGLTGGEGKWWQEYLASSATNTWFREAQWHDHDLPTLGLDSLGVIELDQGHLSSHAAYSVGSRGSFSTGGMLPMGILKSVDRKEIWLWQIENNGSWRWEIGDWKDDIYVALGGPTSNDHEWKEAVSPGQSFSTVPAALVYVDDGGVDEALAALTQYRRHIRRPHKDNETLPIIFNDYMNCLMGDPTEAKVKALIQPALSAGAEYFVIDAGWFAEDTDWWDGVGAWEPSTSRFPAGFKSLISHIRSTGMIPGCWVEPEVMGISSPAVTSLPPEAFFHESNTRIVEKRRHQLDFRHPAVIARMNHVIDTLVLDYGIAYFKFDHNISVTHGTDINTFSPGSAFLAHNRAYLAWVTSLLDRHPGLVIEACASGGQRLDYATLAVHPVQSTSDQQDAVRYAAVSAAIATAVTPEQSASWAYPQPSWPDELIAFTVVNSLMGRVHLSGRIDLLSEEQLALVRQGMDVYKSMRMDVKNSVPFWPLGLPGWHDEWLAVGLKVLGRERRYVAVWRRGGGGRCEWPITGVSGGGEGAGERKVETLYPVGAQFETEAAWSGEKGVVEVTLPEKVCARLLLIK